MRHFIPSAPLVRSIIHVYSISERNNRRRRRRPKQGAFNNGQDDAKDQLETAASANEVTPTEMFRWKYHRIYSYSTVQCIVAQQTTVEKLYKPYILSSLYRYSMVIKLFPLSPGTPPRALFTNFNAVSPQNAMGYCCHHHQRAIDRLWDAGWKDISLYMLRPGPIHCWWTK